MELTGHASLTLPALPMSRVSDFLFILTNSKPHRLSYHAEIKEQKMRSCIKTRWYPKLAQKWLTFRDIGRFALSRHQKLLAIAMQAYFEPSLNSSRNLPLRGVERLRDEPKECLRR